MNFLKEIHEALEFKFRPLKSIFVTELEPIIEYQKSNEPDPAFLYIDFGNDKVFFRIDFPSGESYYSKEWYSEEWDETKESIQAYKKAIDKLTKLVKEEIP